MKKNEKIEDIQKLFYEIIKIIFTLYAMWHLMISTCGKQRQNLKQLERGTILIDKNKNLVPHQTF